MVTKLIWLIYLIVNSLIQLHGMNIDTHIKGVTIVVRNKSPQCESDAVSEHECWPYNRQVVLIQHYSTYE